MVQAAPRGQGPDVFIGANDWLGELVESGIVEPYDLTPIAGEFQEVAVQAMNYDGQTYGLPYATENIALYRNTDLVPDAPATFEELEQIALDLQAQDSEILPLGLQQDPADPYHNYPMFSGGGGYVFGLNADGSYNTDDVGIGSEGGQAAGALFQQWTASGLVSGSVSQDIMKQKFTSGKSPFAITGPWNLSDFEDSGVNFVVEPVPPVNGNAARPFVGVSAFFVSAFSENKDLAKTFLADYINTKDVALELYEAQDRPPARTDAFAEIADDPIVQGFGAAAANGEPIPNIPAMNSVWDSWSSAYQLIFGGSDGAQAMADAGATIEGLIAG